MLRDGRGEPSPQVALLEEEGEPAAFN